MIEAPTGPGIFGRNSPSLDDESICISDEPIQTTSIANVIISREHHLEGVFFHFSFAIPLHSVSMHTGNGGWFSRKQRTQLWYHVSCSFVMAPPKNCRHTTYVVHTSNTMVGILCSTRNNNSSETANKSSDVWQNQSSVVW